MSRHLGGHRPSRRASNQHAAGFRCVKAGTEKQTPRLKIKALGHVRRPVDSKMPQMNPFALQWLALRSFIGPWVALGEDGERVEGT
jgi:hypothetical protein